MHLMWSQSTSLYNNLQKRYSKKGSELEKLQDLLLPLQSKVCRARQDGFNAGQLFDTDQIKTIISVL